MDTAARKKRIGERVEGRAKDLDRLALEIHSRPELAFEERFAADSLADYLESEKVTVQRGAGGLETAFVAEAGSGGPVVAILGEYDALPGIGHGCGHNLMGTAAVGAFLALRDTLDGVRGRVRIVGCPAEERGNGKVLLMAGGAFEGVEAALMYHPGDRDEIDPLMLAMVNLDVELLGKAAHAAAEPYDGVNALDGLVLGWNAMSALRLLVRSDSRIHGIITDGGKAANIIPDRAAARLMVRSPDNAYLADLRRRVLACFEGAAVATGAELRPMWSEVCEVVNTNRPLAEAFAETHRQAGKPMIPLQVVQEVRTDRVADQVKNEGILLEYRGVDPEIWRDHILQRFFGRFAVGHATGQVGHGREMTATVTLRQALDAYRVFEFHQRPPYASI